MACSRLGSICILILTSHPDCRLSDTSRDGVTRSWCMTVNYKYTHVYIHTRTAHNTDAVSVYITHTHSTHARAHIRTLETPFCEGTRWRTLWTTTSSTWANEKLLPQRSWRKSRTLNEEQSRSPIATPCNLTLIIVLQGPKNVNVIHISCVQSEKSPLQKGGITNEDQGNPTKRSLSALRIGWRVA